MIKDGHMLFAASSKEDHYHSIGGAVQIDESSEEAALREAWEEPGIHFQIKRPVFLHESLFRGTGTLNEYKLCHEVAVYYLMKLRGTRELDGRSMVTACGDIALAANKPSERI